MHTTKLPRVPVAGRFGHGHNHAHRFDQMAARMPARMSHLKRGRRRRAKAFAALEALETFATELSAPKARRRQRFGKAGMRAGALALMAGAAGIALKNRDRLMKMGKSDQSPPTQ